MVMPVMRAFVTVYPVEPVASKVKSVSATASVLVSVTGKVAVCQRITVGLVPGEMDCWEKTGKKGRRRREKRRREKRREGAKARWREGDDEW